MRTTNSPTLFLNTPFVLRRAPFVVGVFLAVVFLCPILATAVTIFESGTLGTTGVTWQQGIDGEVPGSNISGTTFEGVRFQVIQPSVITQIGGQFVGPPEVNGTFFGAIIRLADQDDFPDSGDLSTSDVLGTSILTFPEPSDEVFADLAVSLDAGWYALVFGSGLFAATGNGGVLRNSTDIGNPDYIGFHPGFGWGNRLPSKRFIILGTFVPEPTSMVLAFSASLLLTARMRSR